VYHCVHAYKGACSRCGVVYIQCNGLRAGFVCPSYLQISLILTATYAPCCTCRAAGVGAGVWVFAGVDKQLGVPHDCTFSWPTWLLHSSGEASRRRRSCILYINIRTATNILHSRSMFISLICEQNFSSIPGHLRSSTDTASSRDPLAALRMVSTPALIPRRKIPEGSAGRQAVHLDGPGIAPNRLIRAPLRNLLCHCLASFPLLSRLSPSHGTALSCRTPPLVSAPGPLPFPPQPASFPLPPGECLPAFRLTARPSASLRGHCASRALRVPGTARPGHCASRRAGIDHPWSLEVLSIHRRIGGFLAEGRIRVPPLSGREEERRRRW